MCIAVFSQYLLVCVGHLRNAKIEKQSLIAYTSICNVPCPSLLAELLLWAALAHCAFGLWQQTYFRPLFKGDGIDSLGAAGSSFSKVEGYDDILDLHGNPVGKRITQANGIALLLMFLLLGFWLIIGRWGRGWGIQALDRHPQVLVAGLALLYTHS